MGPYWVATTDTTTAARVSHWKRRPRGVRTSQHATRPTVPARAMSGARTDMVEDSVHVLHAPRPDPSTPSHTRVQAPRSA